MTHDELKTKLESVFSDRIQALALSAPKEVLLTVKAGDYLSLCRDLKDSPDFDFKHLSCLTAVDYPKDNRITVVNHLWSYRKCHQLTVKLELDRTAPKAPTLVGVWKSADWFEREVFDLYGVVFEGHPDLRRIMMPEDYTKHPLRKDFTDDGFIVKPN
jgi:NADH-quinone oxidoreductase subunit C